MPGGIRLVTPMLFSKGYRAWLLTVLLLTNALNLADRQGIAVVAQAIKLDLKLTDAQMGIIQGLGFAIFYTLLGLPLARMAERMSRVRIIAASLAIFGVMVALCAAAHGILAPAAVSRGRRGRRCGLRPAGRLADR